MKFSRYARLTMAMVVMLGVSAAANATYYNLGDALGDPPPATGNSGAFPPYNGVPTPVVTSGDQLHLSGSWPGTLSPDLTTTYTTTWYFDALVPNLILLNAKMGVSGFDSSNFLAQLFDPSNSLVVDGAFLGTFAPDTVYPLIHLAAAGSYKLVVQFKRIKDNASYTWDARVIPLPAAAWLLLSGVAGLGAMARRRKAAAEA